MLHRDDLKLAKRIIAHDRQAAERFFDEYFPRLYRFVARRIDESACEDIVQETMIRALKSLYSYRGEAALFTWLCQIGRHEISSYRGEAALFTWLCQIGRHEISSYLRRHGQRQQLQISLDDNPQIRAALESIDFQQVDTEARVALEQIVQLTLDYLPEKYSRLLEWKYLEGLSVQEIAARLQTGTISVQSLLARARSAFRDCYREVAAELEVPV